MTDNVDVDPGTGASKVPVGTDDCGAAGHIQRVKLDIGGNGVSSPVVAGNGLPVDGSGVTQPVSAASLPLPTGAATEATLASVKTAVETIDNAISGTGINVSQIGGSAARTANMDTGVGTDTYPVMGLVYQASGGAMQVEQTAGGAFPVRILNTPSAQVFTVDADTVATVFDALCTAGFIRDDALATLANADGTYTQGRVDSQGALWVRQSQALPAGAIDSGNSTTAALIANATFTGTGVEVLDKTSAEVTVFADVASATDGLKLQTSPDNSNWDHQHTYSVPAMAAGEGLCFQYTLSQRYFRVVYTNGSGAQATFRLQTRLNSAPAAPHYHAISHTLDVDHPAQTVRAVITGQTTAGGGGLVNVKVNPSGTLTVEAAVSSIAAGTNNIGGVTPKPGTSGGLSIGKLISAASTNATSLKASAGQVYTIYAHNINAAVRYLKIYNKASAPTVGTDTPVMTLPIPANAAGNGFVIDTGGIGIEFTTGIAYALTTGVADSDTAAVAANEIVLTILYK